MKTNTPRNTILIIILSFVLYYLLFLNFKPLKTSLDQITNQGLVSYILTYFIVGLPIFVGTYLINKSRNIFKLLGLGANLGTGICTSALFTLPMFIGGLLFFDFNPHLDIQNLIAATIIAGFMEELYFRGFLFGQIFRKTNLGFLSSIFIGALIFACGHLYQSQDIAELMGIFMITFSGAILFAWLFVEWNYNLWVPIFTHTLMNLSWNIFEISSSALGDLKANIFRGLTIIFAILFTVLYKKRRNQKLLITKHSLIRKEKNNLK